MLSALRWVIVPSTSDEIENMIPEAQIDPATGARRFMDYLGFERGVEDGKHNAAQSVSIRLYTATKLNLKKGRDLRDPRLVLSSRNVV